MFRVEGGVALIGFPGKQDDAWLHGMLGLHGWVGLDWIVASFDGTAAAPAMKYSRSVDRRPATKQHMQMQMQAALKVPELSWFSG